MVDVDSEASEIATFGWADPIAHADAIKSLCERVRQEAIGNVQAMLQRSDAIDSPGSGPVQKEYCDHLWTRRRDGRYCVECRMVEFGNF